MENNITLKDSIKTIVGDYMDASDVSTFLYGTVVSASPVSVFVNEKLTLSSEFIVIPRWLTDYEYDVEIKYPTDTGGSPSHDHALTSVKKIKIKNALKPGDRVILIRQHGGQQYLILDRVG